jgi:hypothetical protein
MPEPRCPKCHAVVEPSWDWCMGCGYDPTGARPAAGETPVATRDGVGTWQAPRPPGDTRTGVTRVTTLVGPDAARPQEMRDPDWVEVAPRRLPIPALVGLVAVVAAAIGALVLVTLIVLHRPIGTTGGANLQDRRIEITG